MIFTALKTTPGRYIVYSGDTFLGYVEKSAQWTVRGTRIEWKLFEGVRRYVGTEMTRKAAGERLERMARAAGK